MIATKSIWVFDLHLNAHTHADINRSEEEEEEHEIIPDRSVALKQLAQSSCVFFNLTEWNAIIFFWMRMCFFSKRRRRNFDSPISFELCTLVMARTRTDKGPNRGEEAEKIWTLLFYQFHFVWRISCIFFLTSIDWMILSDPKSSFVSFTYACVA